MAVDTAGSVYVADRGNSTIRKTVANMFTITATAGPNGTITSAGVIGVASGATITFTITPNVGYHVADVVVDGVSKGGITTRSFGTVTANHTISATFRFVGFQITSSAGANGTLSPLGATLVPTGTNQTYTITPSTGYHVADVLVDGSSVGAVTSYTFNSVTAVHTIAASFAINTFVITTTAGVGGTITPANPAVNYGANQTFTIAAVTGYHVLNVVVDTVSQGPVASYTFTNVTTTHAISATFEADPAITVTSPTAGTTWTSGTPQSLGFTVSPAVSVGAFDDYLINTVTGVWYYTGSTLAASGQTIYAPSFSTVGMPAGSYTVYVSYRTNAAAWANWTAAAQSAFGAVTLE